MIIIITDETVEQITRPLFDALKKLDGIQHTQENIMSKVDDLKASLDEIDTKITKIGSETSQALTKITELQNSLVDMNVPQEVLDKVAAIGEHLTAVDALIPDAAEPTS
jgi:peptidoglycan hydrolase CwlO-like protein